MLFVPPPQWHAAPAAAQADVAGRRAGAGVAVLNQASSLRGAQGSGQQGNVGAAPLAGLTLAAGLLAGAGERRRRRTSCAAAPAAVKVRAAASTEEVTRATPSPHDQILRVARGEDADHTPVWLMRQAGRYMKSFRAYSEKYPFRQRSETPAMATELSLQCWRRYGMDGVIFFSDILTPLPSMNIEFDVIRGRGPIVMGDLARTLPERLTGDHKRILEVTSPEGFLTSHGFLRETLSTLRKETEGRCTLLGFVGAPWTLAAYSVEGGSTKTAEKMKKLMYEEPAVVEEFLRRMTETIANYAVFQVQSGAQAIQIFDSWAHCMDPEMWTKWAMPSVRSVAERVRKECPGVPVMYFANGGSSYLRDQVESLSGLIDVLSVDQFVRMSEAAEIAKGSGITLQGNTDPFVLRYGNEAQIRDAVRRCIDDAGGPGKHIMNLGHGVLQGTPEENVGFFVEESQTYGA